MDKITSQTINFLRFPLIICVVSIHTVFIVPGNLRGYEVFKYILGCFTGLAVPMFFIISSFLFFYDMKEFDTQKWCVKLKKRIKTLLMPYLFWNLCYLLFMLIVQLSFPNIVWERKLIYNYSFFELINSFWNFGGMYYGMPILYSFWFIRNLMVLNLFAPIFYFLLKKTPVISIVICLIFFIFNPFNFTATNMDWIKSILFYSIGAFCAIHAIDFTDSRNLFYPFSIFFILSVVLAYFTPNFIRFCWSQILLIFGSFSIPTIIRRGILSKKIQVNKFLVVSSFFVYAFHLFIIIPFNRLWTTILPISSWIASIMLIVVPVFVVFISVCIYYLLKVYFPKFTELIIGGR